MANKPGEANFFPDVPEFPSMGVFQPIYGKFDLTTYIQGASDYEIMAFLVGKYNACLEAYGNITKLSTDTITACKQLQDWINNWFDNLDVQEELNKKIDSMVQDGSFGRLLHQTFDTQINQQTTNTVTQWLIANVTPTGSAVVVDKSLSIEGAAADAYSSGALTGTQLFIPANGNLINTPVGEICDVENINSSNWKHCITEASTGSYLVSFTNSENNAGVMFLDDNNRVLYNSSFLGIGYLTRILYAPKNTAKIAVNVLPPATGSITKAGNIIELWNKNVTDDNMAYFMTPIAGYIQIGNVGETLNLDPITSDGYHTITTITGGSQFIITAFSGVNNTSVCLCDDDYKILVTYVTPYFKQIIAPPNATKLICNFRQGFLQFYPITYFNKCVNALALEVVKTKRSSRNNLFYNSSVLGKYRVGKVGELFNPNNFDNDENYMSVFKNCNNYPVLRISGYTITNDYPVYAFLNKDNVIINKSTSTNLQNALISVPHGATSVVLNVHANNGYAEFYTNENAYNSEISSSFKNKFIYLDASTPASYYAYKNGKRNFTPDMSTYLIENLGKNGDKMVHVGTTLKINNLYYATYYANTKAAQENPKEQEARFVITDGTSFKYNTIISAGDVFDTKTVTEVYDTVLMTIDNNTLLIEMAVSLNNEYHRLYKTYNISTETFSAINYCTIDNVIWNSSNFEQLLPNPHKTVFNDIGLMATLSKHVENNVTYYYTGAYYGGFTCIVKSTDCINWKYVSTPPNFLPTIWENAVYCVNDTIFYYVRCDNTVNYDLLMTYDINTEQWTPQLKIYDCHSRGCFFEYNNELYLAHAPFSRDCIELIKINTENPKQSTPYALGCKADCFYPFITSTSDKPLMTYTEGRYAIRVCELNMPYDNYMTCYNN